MDGFSRWTDGGPYAFQTWLQDKSILSDKGYSRRYKFKNTIVLLKKYIEKFVSKAQTKYLFPNTCTAMIPSDTSSVKWIQVNCDEMYRNVRFTCEKRCNDTSESFFDFETEDVNLVNFRNELFHCREGWFQYSGTCYRVFKNFENSKQNYRKTCKLYKSELATALPIAIDYHKDCYGQQLEAFCARQIYPSETKNCFIHVMLTHWTHDLHGTNALIYSGDGVVLTQNGTLLYDTWLLWYAKLLVDKKNSEITHVACQIKLNNRKDLSYEGGLYKCLSNGTYDYLPRYYVCDGKRHCLYGEDEENCEYDGAALLVGLSTVFQCPDKNIISLSLVGNGVVDCTSGADESRYFHQNVSIPIGKAIIDRCVHDRSLRTTGTSFCMFYECPYLFKCPNYYCIPFKYVCDAVQDCPNGEDEDDRCLNQTCPGMFRCVYGSHCLHPNKVCDGIKNCNDISALGEDEFLCNISICHPKCNCFGHAFDCSDGLHSFIPVTDANALALLFSRNKLNIGSIVWANFLQLLRLDISYNDISKLQPFTFSNLSKLLALSLEGNRLKRSEFVFFGLINLDYLNLENNHLNTLNKHYFWGLNNLKVLKLGYQRISHIDECTFQQLRSLAVLDFVSNNLNSIGRNIFCTEMFKTTVNFTGNDLNNLRYDSLQDLREFSNTFFSSSKFCCFDSSPLRCGYILKNQFICRNIIDSSFLRFMTWTTGLWSFGSNFFVIVWRFRRHVRNASSLIIQNLAVADGTMGFYLLLLAVSDQVLGKNYILNTEEWLGSQLCRIAGALCSFSMESSLLPPAYVVRGKVMF